MFRPLLRSSLSTQHIDRFYPLSSVDPRANRDPSQWSPMGQRFSGPPHAGGGYGGNAGMSPMAPHTTGSNVPPYGMGSFASRMSQRMSPQRDKQYFSPNKQVSLQ